MISLIVLCKPKKWVIFCSALLIIYDLCKNRVDLSSWLAFFTNTIHWLNVHCIVSFVLHIRIIRPFVVSAMIPSWTDFLCIYLDKVVAGIMCYFIIDNDFWSSNRPGGGFVFNDAFVVITTDHPLIMDWYLLR